MVTAHDVQKHEPSEPLGRYLLIYVCILILAAAQFFIAFTHIDAEAMFTRMLFVAVAEAALALLFFMHLWAEKRGFLLFVVVFTVFVLLAMQYGWTDSSRMEVGAPYSQSKSGTVAP
jgi:heme/copper-type cytochrome/quinol oxidase subunit 4